MDQSKLIHKVLTGSATEQERAELDSWIGDDPSNAREFEEMKILYSDDWEDPNQDYDDTEGLQKLREAAGVHARKQRMTSIAKTAVVSLLISAVIFVAVISILHSNSGQPSIVVHRKELVLKADLSFDKATVQSIFKVLEEKYDLQFTLRDSTVLSCTFTGAFHRGVTIHDVITTLSQSENFTFEFLDGNRIQVSGNGC